MRCRNQHVQNIKVGPSDRGRMGPTVIAIKCFIYRETAALSGEMYFTDGPPRPGGGVG